MRSLPKRILFTALLAGTLDICSAFIYVMIKTGKNPIGVLSYIASAILGKEAADGSAPVLLLGLALHYIIAFSFVCFFFLLYPRLSVLRGNKWTTAAAYGLFVWCIMNLVVVPLTRIPARPFVLSNALINIAILMVCIGLPTVLMADRFYRRRSADRMGSASTARPVPMM